MEKLKTSRTNVVRVLTVMYRFLSWIVFVSLVFLFIGWNALLDFDCITISFAGMLVLFYLGPCWITKKRWKRWITRSILFGGLFIVMYFILPVVPISRETTRLTAPLTVKGRYVDYFRAIKEKECGVSSEENGVRFLLQKLGAKALFSSFKYPATVLIRPFDNTGPSQWTQEYWESACHELNLPLDTAASVDWEQYRTNDRELSDFLTLCQGTPWTARDFPQAATWLEKNSPALDLFCESIEKPFFIFPAIRHAPMQPSRQVPQYASRFIQPFYEGLQMRIGWSLGKRDMQKVLADIHALHKLNDRWAQCHFGSGASWLNRERRNCDIMRNILLHGRPDSAICAVIREYASNPKRSFDWLKFLEEERIQSLEIHYSLFNGYGTCWDEQSQKIRSELKYLDLYDLFWRVQRLTPISRVFIKINRYYDLVEANMAAGNYRDEEAEISGFSRFPDLARDGLWNVMIVPLWRSFLCNDTTVVTSKLLQSEMMKLEKVRKELAEGATLKNG